MSSLKLKWAFAFPEATIVRSKPAIVDDWLIVGGQFGDVLAIHKHTGKIGWNFIASAAIRGAIAVIKEGNSIIAFFADYSTNVYAIDVKTGKMIWNKRAGFDPQSSTTGSVTVYNGKVYVPISSIEVAVAVNGNYNCCFSSGGVVALDAKTGREVWRYRIVPPAIESAKKKNGKPIFGPSGAPVWCSPTIDTKSPDSDFGMAPILVKRINGKEVLVAGQKSGVVYALSPEGGKLIWQTRICKGGKLGRVHWGMATDGKHAYAANSDNILGIDQSDSLMKPSPGIYAIDLNTGKVIWKTPAPDCLGKKGCLQSNSAAPAVIPGIVFAGALDGHIRAYAAGDGRILWDFDTVKEYETTSGIKGKGGSLGGPAPVVSDGMLLVNSGYGMYGQIPGNELVAFEVDKK